METGRTELKVENLNVGDTVAYPIWVGGYGWRYRYPRWVFDKIERITPKRTRVYLKNGEVKDMRHGTHLYAPDAEMSEENMRTARFSDCVIILESDKNFKWKYDVAKKISRLSEEEIDVVAAIAKRIAVLMSEIKSLLTDVANIIKNSDAQQNQE